jgi:outer membrane protein TolC
MSWLLRMALVVLASAGFVQDASASVTAEEPARADSLTLQEVLGATDATHPDLEAADTVVEKAAGKRLSARGAWDPNLQVRSRWSPVGYYDNGQVDVIVRQATPLWGIGLYGGYRVGLGTYPVYKGELQTLSGGEARAGIDVPLWKDGLIDGRRAEVRRTKILADAAECERNGARLAVGQKAARAYWDWVAAGQEARVQRDLLAVAEERAAALQEQARAGSIAGIVVVDNERLVLDRRAKLIAARREFQAATLELSLFVRNTAREPVRVAEDRVPRRIEDVRDVDILSEDAAVEAALNRRPEICRLRLERAAAEVAVKLARNQRAPAVNAQAFVARDFGAGPAELGPTEFGVGVVVEMPLALRQARGEYRAAKAEARGIDAQLRGLRDKISAEVRQARVDLDAAEQRIEVARAQIEAAETLADAERDKFKEGASDLVIVNLRELAAADAARLEIEALAAHQRARADYLTATGRGL